MIWTATQGNATVYILGTFQVQKASVEPLSLPVQKVLECADVAYFELPCSAADPATGVSDFLAHCSNYPISSPQHSIVSRLTPEALVGLKTGLSRVLASSPPVCAQAAASLRASVDRLENTTMWTQLSIVYSSALKVLDANSCALGQGGSTLADWIRAEFDNSGRPTFGLVDVGGLCSAYQAAPPLEDAELARLATANFINDTWLATMKQQQAAMPGNVRCGNLDALLQLQGASLEIPSTVERMIAQKNVRMAERIRTAMAVNPGKVVLAAMGAMHLIDVNGGAAKSVLTLLTEAGFTVQRLGPRDTPSCAASTYRAPGAKQQGKCLFEPFKDQTAPCTKFPSVLSPALSKDPMYGRTWDNSSCDHCRDATQACKCKVDWGDYSAFRTLCENTVVDGDKGQVLEADMIRNPGSQEPSKPEVTMESFVQNCYASSCDVDLLRTSFEREWYKADHSLVSGRVMLHAPQSQEPAPPEEPASSSWMWLWFILPLLLLCLVLGLVYWCFGKKHKSHGKKSNRSGRQHERFNDEQDYYDKAREEPVLQAAVVAAPSYSQQQVHPSGQSSNARVASAYPQQYSSPQPTSNALRAPSLAVPNMEAFMRQQQEQLRQSGQMQPMPMAPGGPAQGGAGRAQEYPANGGGSYYNGYGYSSVAQRSPTAGSPMPAPARGYGANPNAASQGLQHF